MQDTKELKKRFRRKAVILVAALLACVVCTYAWYIYNASRHVTDVKMAAGTGVSFLISNEYNGDYKTNAGLSFEGLLNPVSTDNIQNGFQVVTGFTGGTTQSSLFASVFAPAQRSDYYETSLYLTTSSLATDVYVSDIAYQEQDWNNLISTALRVGLLVHSPGENQPIVDQYVFELTQDHNPEKRYNTLNGREGSVLDSTKSDGSTVDFSGKLLDSSNYCRYDETTGKLELLPGSKKICSLPAAADGQEYGTPVQVDVYVWLEGCDEDCTNNLAATSLQSLAIHFAGDHE